MRSRHAWTKKNPSSGDLITDFHDSYVNESTPLPSLQPVAAYNNAYYAHNVNNNAGNSLKFHQESTYVNSLSLTLANRRPLVKPFSELLSALCIQTDAAQARYNGLAMGSPITHPIVRVCVRPLSSHDFLLTVKFVKNKR